MLSEEAELVSFFVASAAVGAKCICHAQCAAVAAGCYNSTYAICRIEQEAEEAKKQATARAAAGPPLTKCQLKKQQHAARMQLIRDKKQAKVAQQASPAGTLCA